MGKTTFMLKLFKQYSKKIITRYKIVLISLNLNDVIESIQKIENQSKTILLLDGFDEDKFAMKDYTNRLETIYSVTELFFKVIITCRTQFFPNDESIPQYTGRIKYGTGKKGVKFTKFYISPFNELEINYYLQKKYNRVFEKDKILRSQKLISNCPYLMVRPMLLSYIDDLIENEKNTYDYVYEVYKELVFKWIQRETIKTGVTEELYKFSETIAEYMFFNRTVYINIDIVEGLCKEYNINLNKNEVQSRSLLNRNANGIYKFAHKSILEYFLAKKACEDVEFRKNITWGNLEGYDMLVLFVSEMCDADLKNILKKSTRWLRGYSFKYLYLPNFVLSKMNLINCDFEGSYLKEADLSKTHLQNVNLSKANLEKVNFKKAVFERVTLSGAKLIKADLTGVELQMVELDGVQMENVELQNQSIVGMNLNGAILRNSDLSHADLRDTNLHNVDLMGTNLSNADLRGANLSNANLKDVNLIGAKLDEMQASYLKSEYGFFDVIVMVSESETGENISMRI